MSSGAQPPRVRHDPRAEPEDEPNGDAADAPSSGAIKAHDDKVSLPPGRPPMSALGGGGAAQSGESRKLKEPARADGEVEAAATGSRHGHGAGPVAITSVDPRLAEIEPLIGRGDWNAVAKQLGPFDRAGALPPQLGLIYAIAVNEAPQPLEGQDASALAIRCVAAMCGVAEGSGFALVMAKRLLRKNPVSFRAKQAPPARTSFLIIAITLLVGSLVGYVLSSGKIHLPA